MVGLNQIYTGWIISCLAQRCHDVLISHSHFVEFCVLSNSIFRSFFRKLTTTTQMITMIGHLRNNLLPQLLGAHFRYVEFCMLSNSIFRSFCRKLTATQMMTMTRHCLSQLLGAHCRYVEFRMCRKQFSLLLSN